jgi:hypothetical protein
MGGNRREKVLGCIFLILVCGVVYVHWASDKCWSIDWKFNERHIYLFICTVFRVVDDKVGRMVLDTFWYLVDKGPRDFVVIVLFTGVGLLGCFLKFTNYSETTKDFVAAAFFLSVLGWLCYCF